MYRENEMTKIGTLISCSKEKCTRVCTNNTGIVTINERIGRSLAATVMRVLINWHPNKMLHSEADSRCKYNKDFACRREVKQINVKIPDETTQRPNKLIT